MAGPELPASALVDAIDDALLVLDEADEIVECNEAFETLVATDGEDCTGPIDSTLSDYPELRDHLQQRTEGVIPIETDSETEYYKLSTSPVENGTDRNYELVVFHDVTTHQQQQRELERENEHLDRFARVISHDLRNPLDVAIGRTTVVGELVDDPDVQDHVDEIAQAHSRMLRIIDDVLTLARQGKSIDEKREIDIAALADDAWSHVETPNATLRTETTQTVLADPTRLEQVFENLFRNAVEHGSTGPESQAHQDAVERGTASGTDSLTVTVGDLDGEDGFYVADDGVGIPRELHENVLEVGFSTDDGTGLGLGIVSNIADAHEWDVSVRESEAGGARFEFAGVDLATGVTAESGQ